MKNASHLVTSLEHQHVQRQFESKQNQNQWDELMGRPRDMLNRDLTVIQSVETSLNEVGLGPRPNQNIRQSPPPIQRTVSAMGGDPYGNDFLA